MNPNSAVSAPYIPGGLIRAALIERYLREQAAQNYRLDTCPEGQALFLRDQTLIGVRAVLGVHSCQGSPFNVQRGLVFWFGESLTEIFPE